MAYPKCYIGVGKAGMYNSVSIRLDSTKLGNVGMSDLCEQYLVVTPKRTPDKFGNTHNVYFVDRYYKYPELHYKRDPYPPNIGFPPPPPEDLFAEP